MASPDRCNEGPDAEVPATSEGEGLWFRLSNGRVNRREGHARRFAAAIFGQLISYRFPARILSADSKWKKNLSS